MVHHHLVTHFDLTFSQTFSVSGGCCYSTTDTDSRWRVWVRVLFLKSITSKSAECWAANTMLSQKSLLWAGRYAPLYQSFQLTSAFWLSFSRFIPAVIFRLVSTGLSIIQRARFEPISAYRLSLLLNKWLWYFDRHSLLRTGGIFLLPSSFRWKMRSNQG